MIVCRTLGPVELTIDGGPAPRQLLWRKYFALLIYLARSPRRGRAREHLVSLLWPDTPESRAGHSLNEAVSVLRRHLGDAAVDTSGGLVRLAPGVMRLDLDRFTELAGAGDWRAAAELISGEFLEGFSVPRTSGFEDWLTAERAQWRDRSVEVLVQRVESLLREGRTPEGAALARRALTLDPLSDSATRSAMRALALNGERTAALELFEEAAVRLRSELNAEPAAETTALADRIRRERTGRPGPASKAATRRDAQLRLPLAGREAELGRLLETAGRCRNDRRSSVLVVEGESGMGKTRLLEELLARLRLEGAAVAAARAVEADRGEPWNSVLALARGGLLEARGLAAAPASALAVLASESTEWADRFPQGPLPPPPMTLGRALSETLRAAIEEQPIFLAVDDAQWMDRDSILALAASLRDLASAPFGVVLGVVAPGERAELDELRARIGRDLDGCAVSVGPLGPGPLRELARHALAGYDDVELDRLVRRIGTDTAGVPLLAAEILRAVVLGLDLQAVSGAWPEPFRTLDQSLPGDLPDAVVAAIRIGFGRLSPDAKRVLAAASVLGDRVAPAALENALEMPIEVVNRALDELEWQRWLQSEARGYAFVARIVREIVARDMLTPGQRRRLGATVTANRS